MKSAFARKKIRALFKLSGNKLSYLYLSGLRRVIKKMNNLLAVINKVPCANNLFEQNKYIQLVIKRSL